LSVLHFIGRFIVQNSPKFPKHDRRYYQFSDIQNKFSQKASRGREILLYVSLILSLYRGIFLSVILSITYHPAQKCPRFFPILSVASIIHFQTDANGDYYAALIANPPILEPVKVSTSRYHGKHESPRIVPYVVAHDRDLAR